MADIGLGAAVAAGLMGVASLSLLSPLAVPALRRALFKKISHESLADKLGWLDAVVIEPAKPGSVAPLVAVRTITGGVETLTLYIRVHGASSASMSEDDLVGARRLRRDWLSHLGDLDVHLHLWHERHVGENERQHGAAASELVRELVGRHEGAMAGAVSETHHILAINASGRDAGDRLVKAWGWTKDYLEYASPRALDPRPSGVENDLLTWLARMVNRTASRPVHGAEHRIAYAAATGELWQDKRAGILTFEFASRRTFAMCISASDLGQETSEEFLAAMMSVPGEWCICHQIRVLDASASLNLLDIQSRNHRIKEGSEGAIQIETLKNMVTPESGHRERMCLYELIVWVFGSDLEEVAEARDRLVKMMMRYKMTPVPDKELAGYLWWGQWPGYSSLATVRVQRLPTANVASMLAFDRQPEGMTSCDWGRGWVMSLPTIAGGIYRFCFHATPDTVALGHTVFFGPAGRGKTTLVQMMMMGVRHHFPEVACYVGDRHLGQYVAQMAAGAAYVGLLSQLPGLPKVALNPTARRPMDKDLLVHIKQLLRLMTRVEEGVDQEFDTELERMLLTLHSQDLHGVPVEERSLATLVAANTHPGSLLQRRLAPWLPGGTLELVLGRGEETLPLDTHDHVAFDFTSVLDDPEAGPVVISDFVHLIQQRARRSGKGALIVLDEARRLFGHPMFAAAGAQWHEEMRKAHVVLVTMFQRPSQLMEIGGEGVPKFAQMIRTQTATHVFLPDQQCFPAEYGDWLTPEEMALVRGEDPRVEGLRHYALIKKPATGESVVVRTDLGHLGTMLALFRSDGKASSYGRGIVVRHGTEGFGRRYLDGIEKGELS